MRYVYGSPPNFKDKNKGFVGQYDPFCVTCGENERGGDCDCVKLQMTPEDWRRLKFILEWNTYKIDYKDGEWLFRLGEEIE